MIAIDIGCGANKKPGAIGVDRAAVRGVDVVAAAERLPFRESSVDAIYAAHVLEHVEPLVPVIEELWRVSKPGARIHVWAPHFTSGLYVWSDPTHRRGFTSLTFD